MSDNTYNVMMLGGRRCGKTSVLASMQSCFEAVLGQSALYMGCSDFDTINILREKYQEISDYFIDKATKRDFVPDSNPTLDIVEHKFFVGLKNKNESSNINMKFIDYLGEYLNDKEKFSILENYMRTSRVLLITIDTPHLMEIAPAGKKVGRYNEVKNLCYNVTEMIKKINFASNDKGPGMVLFIPLKCERYYNGTDKKNMNDVNESVKEAYKNLLNYLNDNKNITVAITPIITMGGAQFCRFARNEENEIIIDEEYKAPKEAIYRFLDMSVNEPSPKFCEQPMVYILSFILANVGNIKWNEKKSKGFFGKMFSGLRDWYYNLPSAYDYFEQADYINDILKKGGNGYSIINKGILYI